MLNITGQLFEEIIVGYRTMVHHSRLSLNPWSPLFINSLHKTLKILFLFCRLQNRYLGNYFQYITRHRNFSRETGKREICRREISHGKIRREKREIVKSKIRVFWPKLKWKYKKTHLIFFVFHFKCAYLFSDCWVKPLMIWEST